jgi:sigma-B regulation protein RsbU (phosphoserine phosphatase)
MSLITATLLISFACYLSLGTSLVIRDKSSYIYDFNLQMLRTVSDSISTDITKLQAISQLMDSAAELAPIKESFYSKFTEKNKNQLPESGLLIFRVRSKVEFEKFLSFPPENTALLTQFQNQKWLPMNFEKSPILIGTPSDGKIPIAIRGRDQHGNPTVIFSSVKISLDAVRDYVGKTQIEVLGQNGERIQSTADLLSTDKISGLEAFEKEILAKPFPSGAEEVRLGNREYLASYNKVQGAPLTVVGFISKDEAFSAASTLVRQSILLAIGVVALGIIAGIYFAKGVTRKLRLLWTATQKIAAGDLDARVPFRAKPNDKGRDEILDLSSSFNRMADQIQALIKETAEKARMKSELETAQTVQSRFLPTQSYERKQFELSGKSIPATECAGDWWQYREIGPYIVVVLGDVTGHGVSSALVTAAAHGTFEIVMKEFQKQFEKNSQKPSLEILFKHLNTAVRATGGDSASMSAILSLIDTRTNALSLVNASHPLAYLHRRGMNTEPEKSFQVLKGGLTDALGVNESPEATPAEFQLEPNDLIFWYTDGLLECANESGEVIRRLTLLKMISELDSVNSAHRAEKVCADLVSSFKSFLGTKIQSPDDDTTIVVAVIPGRSV